MCSGCGCKEVYRFPHITYPYSSCIYPFLQQHPYFFIFFNVFRYFIYTCILIYFTVHLLSSGAVEINSHWSGKYIEHIVLGVSCSYGNFFYLRSSVITSGDI